MITEVLVCMWLAMCAIMVRVPPSPSLLRLAVNDDAFVDDTDALSVVDD